MVIYYYKRFPSLGKLGVIAQRHSRFVEPQISKDALTLITSIKLA